MTFGKMLKLMAGVVGARFLGAGLGLATQLLLARLFGAAELGRIFLGMSAVSLIGLLVSAGYPALAFTEIARLAVRKHARAIFAINGAAMRDTLAIWLLVSAVSYLAASLHILSEDWKSALFFASVAALPVSLIRYNSAIANCLRKFNLSYLPDFILRPLLFLGCIAGAALWDIRLNTTAVLSIFVVLIFVVAILQAWQLGASGLALHDWSSARRGLTKRLRPRAIAMLIVAAVLTAYADLVTLCAGLFLAPHDVALVGVTIRLAAIAAFVIQATQQFMLPDMAETLKSGTRTAADALMLKMNSLSIATMIAGLVGAMLLGRFVLGIFGTDYVQGFGLLMLFLVAQLIRALGGMNQQLLALQGRQLRTAAACLTALAVLVVTAGMFCHLYGVIGIGWAVLLAETAWCLHLGFLAGRHLGHRGDLLWLIRAS